MIIHHRWQSYVYALAGDLSPLFILPSSGWQTPGTCSTGRESLALWFVSVCPLTILPIGQRC
jgi:hypothetical protein